MKKPSKKPSTIDDKFASDDYIDTMVVDAQNNIIGKTLLNIDTSSVSTAKANWYFGEWEELTNIDLTELTSHPDIAILAALKGAGHQQLNQLDEAGKYVRLARKLGCENKLIAKLLIAGVHNTLGRISALQKDNKKIEAHFKSAVDAGEKSQAAKLASHARSVKEILSMGLLPQAAEIIENSVAEAGSYKQRPSSYVKRIELMQEQMKDIKNIIDGNQDVAISGGIQSSDNYYLESPIYSAKSYSLYNKLVSSTKESLLLLEIKSMPRSGLHYFKNTFENLLKKDFSFCEWYQEPGCCKKMPCALTSYAAPKSKGIHIRMTKSHDFMLDDPAYPTLPNIKRIILWRDPLFVLTSLFALDELARHKDLLSESGINMPKIWLKHESQIVRKAYELIDKNFIVPTNDYLPEWLKAKEAYLKGFIKKWISPYQGGDESNIDVVNYDDLPQYLSLLLEDQRSFMETTVAGQVDSYIERLSKNYKPRKNPFMLPSVSLTRYVKRNMDIFIETAVSIQATLD